MVDDVLTVGDLAGIVARAAAHPEKPTDAEMDFAIRRIRNWSTAGALRPAGNEHAGSGKHRFYDGPSVHIAATLNALADADQTIGVLLDAARFIRNVSGGEPLIAEKDAAWAAALDGTEDVFLVVGPAAGPLPGRPRDAHPAARALDLILGRDLDAGLKAWRGGAFVNLTAAFRHLR